MVNNKTDVLGQTTNKEEMLGENGSDCLFGKIIHHIKEKVLNQKDVPQPAPVVNVYQTVGHHPAPAVHHTAVQGLASAAACPGTVTSFEWGKYSINKPAAQAAGADPSRWSSTNRQNPPLQ